jgi:hypothetical protein
MAFPLSAPPFGGKSVTHVSGTSCYLCLGTVSFKSVTYKAWLFPPADVLFSPETSTSELGLTATCNVHQSLGCALRDTTRLHAGLHVGLR